jgi:hypothetical protein
MSNIPAELGDLISGDELGRKIAFLWNRWNIQRRGFIEEIKEQRNFTFATDTSATTGQTTPWKNSTTLPKLTQIRDNLHSNYLSALFPNDDWLKWEAYSKDPENKSKKKAITAYMSNKLRDGRFRDTMSALLYDYIDYGNAFMTVSFEAPYDEDNMSFGYTGPVLERIAPEFIVFDLHAPKFENAAKVIRSIRTIGELKTMAKNEPDNAYLQEALADRDKLVAHQRNYGIEDNDLAEGIQIDGFGNLQEYYQQNYVEMLEFHGDFHDENGVVHENMVVTVIDRCRTIREEKQKSWGGKPPIFHVGWRKRPNNLWCMGPLTNLVGMQYRIDHLENSKADAYDLAIHPPLVIQGEVESFDWGPGCEIHLDEGGSVNELGRNVQWVLQANNEIAQLEAKMEQYAGAPREAMGIRSPGEKTAFEVQALENAAGRIFQEKITTFEVEGLEPALNAMLEVSRRNMDATDVVRVMDDDLGVAEFMSVTASDITAKGKLRPIGARHFAAQAQLLQNLTGVFNSPVGQMVMPHTSSIQLSKLIEDTLGLERFELFRPNVAVAEQQSTQRMVNQSQEDLAAEDATADEEGL